MDEQSPIEDLILNHLQSALNPAQERVLREWIAASPKNKQLFDRLTDKKILENSLKQFHEIESGKEHARSGLHRAQVRVLTNRNRFKRIAIAASIISIIAFGGYILFFNTKDKSGSENLSQQQRFKNDVDPGGYKARLTLADGRIIILDSAGIGELAKQGTTVVVNKDGQLVYTTTRPSTSSGPNETLYNTLSTAKGEAYSTVLSDGSKVWLNSASSIKFPVAFTGNERRVEISGEAYMEVAKDPKKKFIVSTGKLTTEVLGTQFNVNTYDDETIATVTLVEGSVKVSFGPSTNSGTPAVVIDPGQQAIVTPNGGEVQNAADLEKITAWKANVFMFSGDDIQTIMRQIARWYDLEVEYKGQITDRHFTAIISRNNKVSEVLKMLQGTEKIQFLIEGKKIIVSK